MRKGLFFWFSIILSAGIIGGAVFFFGRTPDRVLDVTKAIPVIDVESPHILIVLEAGQIQPGIPEHLAGRIDTEARLILGVVDDMMPLFSFASQSAAALAWDSNSLVFYGCFLLPEEMVSDINAGIIPSAWLEESSGLTLAPSETEGILDLSAGSGRILFKLKTEGKLLMAALSPGDIERMSLALSDADSRMEMKFSLEGTWPAHLKFFDGRILAQAASLRGLKSPDSPISGEVSWNSRGESGELAWILKGLEEWLPETIRSDLTPHEWNEKVHLPEPLIMAAGIAVPGGLERFAAGRDDAIPDWLKGSGMEGGSLEELLPGPLLVTLGGQSRVFLFTLPGILLQLPDRSGIGIKWVEGLWGGKLAGFGLTPKPLDGFSSGGVLSIPFTAVAAARDDLAIAGLINSSSLGNPLPIRDYAQLGGGKALLWFYGDFSKAAEAVDNISKLGSFAERLGAGSSTADEYLQAARDLRSLGKVSLVVHDPGSGRGSWKDAHPAE